MEDDPEVLFESSLTSIRKSAEVQTSIQLSVRNTHIHLESIEDKKIRVAETRPLRRQNVQEDKENTLNHIGIMCS